MSIDRISIPVGDCFEVSVKLMEEVTGLTLVHGLPIGRGPANRGKRYWHAWCEMTAGDGVTRVCLDFSSGKRVALERSLYYSAGQIEQTWEYRLSKMRSMLDRHQHYGPWVEGWKEMAL